MVVRFVDIGELVFNHCLNIYFISVHLMHF